MENKVYQFKAELADFTPKIWRRFQIAADDGLDFLTCVVLALFKAKGYHLAQFVDVSGTEYSFDDECEEIRDFEICDIFKAVGDKGKVEYDFGDGWGFDIKLEKITDATQYEKPMLLDGEGYGIVDDCGGVCGLEDKIKNKVFDMAAAQKTLWAKSRKLIQLYDEQEGG